MKHIYIRRQDKIYGKFYLILIYSGYRLRQVSLHLLRSRKKYLCFRQKGGWGGGSFMVFNATFNTVEEVGVPGENHRPATSH